MPHKKYKTSKKVLAGRKDQRELRIEAHRCTTRGVGLPEGGEGGTPRHCSRHAELSRQNSRKYKKKLKASTSRESQVTGDSQDLSRSSYSGSILEPPVVVAPSVNLSPRFEPWADSKLIAFRAPLRLQDSSRCQHLSSTNNGNSLLEPNYRLPGPSYSLPKANHNQSPRDRTFSDYPYSGNSLAGYNYTPFSYDHSLVGDGQNLSRYNESPQSYRPPANDWANWAEKYKMKK
ncbi:hypothetical protein F4821DRAFT_254631 [Hypoxylon rubiginosum]|uniref:Uncharacterized protein n=1 Tax=Hypoxylon rubiginosum TaxID=110542 RepID=A0ACC0DGA7_9PEZI|nr:hypothetical protein F4821DRAFT_254631 [Hypoxylon rubiginosum]